MSRHPGRLPPQLPIILDSKGWTAPRAEQNDASVLGSVWT
jgi:hypothetical protein